MAEVAKFRKEEMPSGWDAAMQSFRQSPAAAPVRALINTAENLVSLPGDIARAGFRAGQNFDFAAGSGGGILPPAASVEAERVRQELNPNTNGVLIEALPKIASAAVQAPQNFVDAATDQPTYPEAQRFRPANPAAPAMLPSHGTAFVPAAPAINVEDPRAVNYGRGITELINVPGQQGRSFTNLIPAGAPVTGINEMTQRFREQPQGAVSDGGEVLTGTSGRGSLRIAPAPGVAAPSASAAAAATEPTGFRAARSGQRVYAPAYNAVYGSVAQQRQEYDTARLGMRNAATAEINAETAQGNMRTAQVKALADLAKPETMKKVRFAPPAPDPNGLPIKDAEGNITYPMLPAKVTIGDTEFDVSAEDYTYARENANRLAALQLKKNPNVDPETLMNESLQVALADVIRLRNQPQE